MINFEVENLFTVYKNYTQTTNNTVGCMNTNKVTKQLIINVRNKKFV